MAVLQTDNTVLFERLEARGYLPAKVSENVQCEIMNVVVEEARASYRQASSSAHCCAWWWRICCGK